MPQHKSAEKRVRQSERRRQRNVVNRSRMKNAIKKVRNNEDKETASSDLNVTTSILDKLARKGIIHKNRAANLKSKLTKKVSNL